MQTFAQIPMRNVGPIKITGALSEEISVPLATLETPLWFSVSRGARISRLSGGIGITVTDSRMTRSIILEAPDGTEALRCAGEIKDSAEEIQKIVSESSRFARLKDINYRLAANLIYLRLEFFTGDASGHNMVTNAADRVFGWILEKFTTLTYCSISGNFCCDKKVSAVNSILGRGKNVIAEITVPEEICREYLNTTPEKIVSLNNRKNLLGSILAGSLCSANAHYANMLLAFYLATGQDAANIVEGSQGITYAEVRNGALYFSCTMPNLILGTVGNGKNAPYAEKNLTDLGCSSGGEPGADSMRLAAICGAAVLCGELSLMAAEANPGELMKAHIRIERGNKTR